MRLALTSNADSSSEVFRRGALSWCHQTDDERRHEDNSLGTASMTAIAVSEDE